MLKSLYAGVSGLQAHQVAMDVESNNIANVNTVGFKYSRANFSDMLAQTKQIATSPEGSLGGKNAVQVGLGASIQSTTRIHSQGSIQATDKNTDVAIQGDGFFVVSADSGRTTNYTRAGDFKFDAAGNFVDNNGFVVQGWLRDPVKKEVDSSAPISNIQIDPGLTTPAQETTTITLKANLNSGSTVTNISPMRSADSANLIDADNMGALFNQDGDAFNLQAGEGITITINGNATDYKYSTDPNATAPEFHTSDQFVNAVQNDLTAASAGSSFSISSDGRFVLSNENGSSDLTLVVDPISGGDNIKFSKATEALEGVLPAASTGVRQSQVFNAATHSSSIDVFDSLGSKHTIKIDFRKMDVNATDGSTWSTTFSVPEPGEINSTGTGPSNVLTGDVTFTTTGQLKSFTPSDIFFTANNGSTPSQPIKIESGIGSFAGITSYDATSTTSGISQDGYTGGDLLGIRVDQTGTLVGSFSNGRSFGLAQIAMAKFANNEGLSVNGGNIYLQTANSGEPVIGTAATGGRGFIQSSSLESSNADLSRSLTQLIIIQRGYQANGKTITTSDQLLQALLALKN